jgi:hypothetical protein
MAQLHEIADAYDLLARYVQVLSKLAIVAAPTKGEKV